MMNGFIQINLQQQHNFIFNLIQMYLALMKFQFQTILPR